MARTITKRKSESALSAGKTKHRKTSTSNVRDASDSEEQEAQSSYKLFIQEQPIAAKHVKKGSLKSRKSEPARATRDDEYDEDPGRMESQQFLSLVELETKKKKAAVKEASQFLEKFTNDIVCDEQELKNQLELLASAAAKRDMGFLGAFEKAYKAATPCPLTADVNQMKGSPEHPGFAVMYKRSKLLTEVALELVLGFEKVNQQVSGHASKALIYNEWERETEKIAHLVLIGKDLGISRCQSILKGSKDAPAASKDVKDGEALYNHGEDNPSSRWGKVARKGEKAARKLVRAIASEIV